jgi:hypothetical protein
MLVLKSGYQMVRNLYFVDLPTGWISRLYFSIFQQFSGPTDRREGRLHLSTSTPHKVALPSAAGMCWINSWTNW